ncbi:MAG: hypothetical protein GY928_30160 [Colwellia sp.]|nr:hypothetical protein [Colwellia sp.]
MGFYSRKLTDAEIHRSTTDKELLAIDFAIKKLQDTLPLENLVIETDHKPLIPMIQYWKKEPPNNRIARVMERLESSGTKIRYRPGKNNEVADYLSRIR